MSGLILKYFVLKPGGKTPYAVASRNAMLTYACSIKDENPELAAGLVEWVNEECDKADERRPFDEDTP